MSKGLRGTLIGIGVVVAAAALLLAGIYLGQANQYATGFRLGGIADLIPSWLGGYPESMLNSGMMSGRGYGDARMMGPGGYGMMGYGVTESGFGMMGPGMMGGYHRSLLIGAEPLSIQEARTAVTDYLKAIDAEQLTIGEVMIFDNHAYVQVLESDTEIGAFELLVDPITLAVFPEHGPNMMWNLKYGMMGAGGMMGMMGSWVGSTSPMFGMLRGDIDQLDPDALPIDHQQAVQIAQDYLDRYLPGTQAETHADTFYGYYTIHIERSDEVVGMLSVNGSTGQVWLHTWHGDLIEMSEHD